MIQHKEDSILRLQKAEQEKLELIEEISGLKEKNATLAGQVTDLQLALCDVYESVVV